MQTITGSINRFLICAALAAYFASASAAPKQTALDRYVTRPDPNFHYTIVKTLPGNEQTTFVLELTSQQWLTTNEVNRPVWKHWLTIVKPEKVATTKSLLLITGGSIDRPAPKSADVNLVNAAIRTRSIVAELRGVPNEPLVFAGETIQRSEDAIIAYTWDKFLRTGDEKWPARLPMTKSAVKAMDAVTEFCASEAGGKVKVDSFIVSGASKRGWTTWTTAAVDKRVVAIVPLVIDMLNLEFSFKHHYAAYGFWSAAVKDYTALNLMDWMGTKEHHALMEIEEPYEYRDRLTMPKFMIYAAGDQFFLPDSSQFYFDDLPGTKYLRYVPNADHSMRGSDAAQSLMVCYEAVIKGSKLPVFSWTLHPDAIRIATKNMPTEVKLWRATNPEKRDFRLETIGPAWESAPVESDGKGTYNVKIAAPPHGWSAFFAELTFPNVNGAAPFKFTTAVKVLPETLPYKFEPSRH